MKMHAEEVNTSVELVGKLVADQFTAWADLPIKPVDSIGTDHAIYRLGDDMSVRLPRIYWAIDQAAKEHEWLPKIAPHLPLAVPEQLAQGKPAEGYPYEWSVYRWLSGKSVNTAQIPDLNQAALDLAGFIVALQKIDTAGAPPAIKHKTQGLSLTIRDADVRKAIVALGDKLDVKAVTSAWEAALAVPEWNQAPVWFHGDLLPGNVLIEDGKLNAVIDWGGLAAGDPACDLMIAWRLFSGDSRETFRKAMAVDDATWARGRGHALAQALIFLPYYLETNPVGVKETWHAVDEVLADA